MKIAVVVQATGKYIIGAEVLFHTIRLFTNCDGVDLICTSDHELNSEVLDRLGVRNVILPEVFSDIKVDEKKFGDVNKKFFPFLLSGYDRAISIDADTISLKSLGYLFSRELDRFDLAAAPDFGCAYYYKKELHNLSLNPGEIFNSGVLVLNKPLLCGNVFSDIVVGIRRGKIKSYDGGDQGYLNFFASSNGLNVGMLPVTYNYALDRHYPRYNLEDVFIVHFTGAKPWEKTGLSESAFLLWRVFKNSWS